jgi:predicted NAD/FAD-dependent oxidoreductase
MRSQPPEVAVIGAGVAGLSCARALVEAGVRVRVFDKGRSVGGRLAVRRSGAHVFDLGTQYFTAREPRIEGPLWSWIEEGVVAPWDARIVAFEEPGSEPREVEAIARYVGVPDMNALAHVMARGLEVSSSQRLERIERRGEKLYLRGTIGAEGLTLSPAEPGAEAADELGSFDAVAICMPPAQAASLLDDVCPRLAAEAREVVMDPCYALGFAPGDADTKLLAALPFAGAFIGRESSGGRSPLSWIARDSSKPGRPPGERWVLHASAAWSRAMFEAPAEEVTAVMLAELSRLLGLAPLRPAQSFLRRWAHARTEHALECGALYDEATRIGVGGDWAMGGRFEGAYVSGLELAARLGASLR